MATTLQSIMGTIRAANIVPSSHVNYGLTDNLQPPYVALTDYSHTTTYDTGGPAIVDAEFQVVCIAKSAEDAEDLATQVNAVVELNPSLTPQTMAQGAYQESYTLGQLPEKLYQWGVAIKYSLKVDPTVAV